jgi:hypothetical protein
MCREVRGTFTFEYIEGSASPFFVISENRTKTEPKEKERQKEKEG